MKDTKYIKITTDVSTGSGGSVKISGIRDWKIIKEKSLSVREVTEQHGFKKRTKHQKRNSFYLAV